MIEKERKKKDKKNTDRTQTKLNPPQVKYNVINNAPLINNSR